MSKQPYSKETAKKELAVRVRERRKERGLSQEALAKTSTVSFGSVKRFERIGEISLDSLLKIAQALGCTEDFKRLFWKTSGPLPAKIDIAWG